MKQNIVQKILKMNSDFYDDIAPYFDSSRNYYWHGWEKSLERIEKNLAGKVIKKLKVLDLGCGNGRFYDFLEQRLKSKNLELDYTGVDSNDYLISKAKERHDKKRATFICNDILANETYNDLGRFDLVVVFGVMHHIPTVEIRKTLMKKIKALMEDNGLCILTFWDFANDAKLKKRMIPMKEDDFESGEISQADFILSWERGAKSLRYCHQYSKQEINELLDSTEMKIQETFFADGKSNKLNQYYLITKA